MNTMKKKLVGAALTVVALSHSGAQGEGVKLDRNVPLAYPEAAQESAYGGYRLLEGLGWPYLPVKEPYSPIWHMENLLRQGQLEMFYLCSVRLFRVYGHRWVSRRTPERFREVYRLCGLVAAAPLYRVDFSGQHPWRYIENEADLDAKRIAVSYLRMVIKSETALQLDVDRNEVGKVSALYGAVLVRSVREEYLATTDEELKKIDREVDRNIRKWRHRREDFSWRNQFGVANNRNQSMKFWLEEWLEEDFVRILVGYFPGRTAEARRYIRLAGYGDGEIDALVDRTLGRSERTEFLYRSKPGRKRSR